MHLVVITGEQYLKFPKSKLEVEVFPTLLAINRITIQEENIESFKAELSNYINLANKKHNDTLGSTWEKLYSTNDFRLNVGLGKLFTFRLLASTEFTHPFQTYKPEGIETLNSIASKI